MRIAENSRLLEVASLREAVAAARTRLAIVYENASLSTAGGCGVVFGHRREKFKAPKDKDEGGGKRERDEAKFIFLQNSNEKLETKRKKYHIINLKSSIIIVHQFIVSK